MGAQTERDCILEELATLPAGTVVIKHIAGREQPYLQWREGGKVRSRYLKAAERERVAQQIARRQELSARLKEIDAAHGAPAAAHARYNTPFETTVRTGSALAERAARVAPWGRRDSYPILQRYLAQGPADRVCLISGLRRTGKTTMMRQSIADMDQRDQERTAFIEILASNDLGQLRRDLFRLQEAGYAYVFIDEVTLLTDFIDNAALFSDVFAMEGMRIVLTGTDSLGFWFASHEELYDRAVVIHTTHVPFREHARLLGTTEVDEYLEFGGTLRMGANDLDDPYSYDGDADPTFASEESTRRYIDTAIVRNIQNSLAYYRGGTHFRHLRELYLADELTSAINRVIEDMNHEFVAEVLRRDFSSHDLGSARQLLARARDPKRRTDALDQVDTHAVTSRLMELLDVRNANRQSIRVDDVHATEIREYLEALDLLVHVPTEEAAGGPVDRVVFTQPGMRYAQAKALVQALLEDPSFAGEGRRTRRLVSQTILDDVRGRMLEDVVLFETVRALPPSHEAFKLEFAVGEYDMVVYDGESDTCDVYEVKHAQTRHPSQRRFLQDAGCQAACERTVAPIRRRIVLYRGEPCVEDDIAYENVTDYLLGL